MGASVNKHINDIFIGSNAHKILETFKHAYRRAPEYDKIFPLVQSILESPEKNLAKFLAIAFYIFNYKLQYFVPKKF